VPPKNRSGRPTFGGKLLAVPTPLPDDDEAQPVETSTSTVEELPPPAKPTEPTPPLPEHAPPSLEQTPDQRHTASLSRPNRERAPGTIRLNDRAGQALWEAYVEAKIQDPFLSYRQFASGVVHDGIAVHHRRQKRAP
jgi:hypothetical protein